MDARSSISGWCAAGLLAASLVVVSLEALPAAARGQEGARAVRPDVGSVQGTIVFGTGPSRADRRDGGSDVWVLAGRVQLPPDCAVFTSTYELTIGDCATRNLTIPFMKHVQADFEGRFEVRDLSIGDYTLVIRSAHATGTDPRDVGHKFAVSWFTIKGGDTVEANTKF